jgi:hypothetical protein
MLEPAPDLPRTPFDDLDPCVALTCDEVARRLAAHPRSIRRAVARGELCASRACGIRILAGDAAEWWRAQLVKAPAEAPRPRAVPDEPAPMRPSSPKASRPRASERFVRTSERLPLPPRTTGS